MRVCVKYARVCLCVPGLSSSTVAASARQGSRHLPAHPTDARTRSQLGLRGRLLRLLPLEGVAHLAQRRLHATNEAALTRLGSVAAVAAVAAAAAAAAAAAFTARRLPVLRCWLCGLRSPPAAAGREEDEASNPPRSSPIMAIRSTMSKSFASRP